MNGRIHYTHCPVCGSADIRPALQVKDYTVSGELFPVLTCGSCTLRFTQDVPDAVTISPYYKSDSYISHAGEAKGLIDRLYHWVRRRTIRRKRKLIGRFTQHTKGRLLDVGSGIGSFAADMQQHGWDTTGLEPDADARNVAKAKYGLVLGGMDQFDGLPAAGFDVITLWHVLEHVHDLQPYVRRLGDLLDKQGTLFIAVPNYTSYDASLYQEYWAAYDVPRHLYHFSPASLKVLMDKNGLTIRQYLPMWYDSFYISILSNKYKYKRNRLLAACWNGTISNCKALPDPRSCSSVIYVITKQD